MTGAPLRELARRFGVPVSTIRRALIEKEKTGRPLADIVRELAGAGGRSLAQTIPETGGKAGSTGDAARAQTHVSSGPPPDAISSARFDKYEILELLGRGGQGAVYRVRNPVLGRIEVLKVLTALGDGSSDAHRRFEREARTLAQLRHRNILPLYEVGSHEGRPYYTMEYVAGQSVADVLRKEGSLAPRTAAVVARDAARGLAAAHQNGVIHRDVKPGNILLAIEPERGSATPDDEGHSLGSGEWDLARALSAARAENLRVVVVDFGLARVANEESLTAESVAIMGTAPFMSPEQILGEVRKLDERSDVWSLGVTLYVMLTGKLPFPGESLLELQRGVTTHDPEPPGRIRRGIPKDLDAIGGKCLEKDPARRYPNAHDLADDLDRFLQGEAVLARPVGVIYRSVRWIRRHKFIVGSALTTALATAALLFFLVALPRWRERRDDREALAAAVETKHRDERTFDELLAAGRLDEAVALGEDRLGRLPEKPSLHDPDRASDFPELGEPYDMALQDAYLARGERRIAVGDAGGTSDLAGAYQLALGIGDEGTGRASLLVLSRYMEKEGENASALDILRLYESRYEPPPEIRFALARATERSGELEQAFGRWQSLARDPEYGKSAGERLDLLARLLPRVPHKIALGSLSVADLDGDGRAELLHASTEGTVQVLRFDASGPRLLAEISLAGEWLPGYSGHEVGVLDLDGVAPPEIVVAHANPDAGRGSLFVLGWRNSRLERLGQIENGAKVHAIRAADLDRDGRPEWIVANGYGNQEHGRSLRFFRWAEGRVEDLGAMALGVDPLVLEVVLPPPPGEPRFLLTLGPWSRERGFRACIGPPLLGGPDRAVLEAGLLVGEGELLVAANAAVEYEAVLDDLSPAGIYLLPFGPDHVGALRRLELPPRLDEGREIRPGVLKWFTAGGRRLVAYLGERELVLADPSNPEDPLVGSFSLAAAAGSGYTTLHTGDLDGNGDSEIVLQRGSELLEVWGLGEPDPQSGRASPFDVAILGRRSAGDDLLAVRRYEEAGSAFERELAERPGDPSLLYRLGLSLAGRGHHAEAGKRFEEAARSAIDPALVTQAKMALAQSQEKEGGWSNLLGTLESLEASLATDPYAAEQAARWKRWVEPMAGLAPVAASGGDRWLLPLALESPFEFALEPDGQGGEALASWFNSEKPAAGGIPLRYLGGPVRIRATFRVDRLDWESAVTFGIEHADRLSIPPSRRANLGGPCLGLQFWATGAGDAPVMYLKMHVSPRIPITTIRNIRSEPVRDYDPAGRVYACNLTYIPGLDRVQATLLDGETVLWEDEIEVPFPLEIGTYCIGRVLFRPGGSPWLQAIQRSKLVLLKVEIEASHPGTRVARIPEDASGREWLLQANGDLVLGAAEEALSGYETAIRKAEEAGDRYTLWQAHLFRALLHRRQGRLDEAGADVALARGVPGEEVVQVIESASPSLPDPERAFLLDAAKR